MRSVATPSICPNWYPINFNYFPQVQGSETLFVVVLRKRGGLICNGRHDDDNNNDDNNSSSSSRRSSDIHFQALCETLTHTSFTSGISCSRLICHRLPLQSPGTLNAGQQCPPVDHSVPTTWFECKARIKFKVPISKNSLQL